MKNYQYLNLEQKMLRIRKENANSFKKNFTMMRRSMIFPHWTIFTRQ